MLYILRNYAKNGYKNVIVSDFDDSRLKQLKNLFPKNTYLIFTLFLADDEELKKRVQSESRDSGFRDFERSIEWNKQVVKRDALPDEIKIDNTFNKPVETLQIILDCLGKEKHNT